MIKFVAVFIGAVWAWWNYRKSRTYEQKLELDIVGTVLVKSDLYCEVKVTVKNIGETKHAVEHTGTFCELSVVRDDLTEESIELLRVFRQNNKIEPGESINDICYWRVSRPFDDILWVKVSLRVVSNGVEWLSTRLIRVEGEPKNSLNEENNG